MAGNSLAAVSGFRPGGHGPVAEKQTYKASVNLKFINSAAADGYAYDGSKTEDDIEEVKNTDILTEGIQHVGMEDKITADEVAPLIEIEPVIPDDEQKKSTVRWIMARNIPITRWNIPLH